MRPNHAPLRLRLPALLLLSWAAAAMPFGVAMPFGGGAPPAAGELTWAEEQQLELSLADARRIALANNIGLEREDVAVEVQRFTALGRWGAFDPVFDASVRYEDAKQQIPNPILTGVSVLEEDRVRLSSSLVLPFTTGGNLRIGYDRDRLRTNSPNQPPEITSDALFIGFTQPLLRGAWSRAATAEQRQAELRLAQQEELRRQAREELLLQVENAYWDLVAAREEREVRELSVALFQRRVDEERERLRVGVGTEVDVLQAETNLAQQEERLLFAISEVEAREDGLKRLLYRRESATEGEGWSGFLAAWDVPVAPLTPLPDPGGEPEAPGWRSPLERAFEHRSELTRQRFAVEEARVRLDQASSGRLPGLEFQLDARSASFDTSASGAFENTVGFDSPTYGIGLSFNMPLFNRSAAYAERSARAELRSAMLLYEELETTVLAEVRQGVRELSYQRRAVEAARKSRELAERQLDAEEVRYREGLSTTFQLLQFQQDLAEALSAERAALARFAKARAALTRAQGLLDSGGDA